MHKKNIPARRVAGYIALYTLLILLAAVALLPLVYMGSLSLQSDAEVFSGIPVLWPAAPQFQNYLVIWQKAPFARFFLNSFIVAGAITLSHLFFDPLAGYVFAKFRFPLKNVLFLLFLGTMMIPFFVRMIPLYILMAQLNWLDSYQAMIAPFLMSAFGIFLMRQFIQPLPFELIDAARLDGCSEFGIYWRIILPQVKPALATLGLFTFIFQWDEFIWPLIVVNSTEMRTMPIGLTLFNQEYFTQWNYTATGAVVLFVPILVLFLCTQKYFVKGISLTGLK
ncbi:sugar ABC transporter permease [Ktedonobacter sp. SOSP1-52]|uniref:carbohydrate ABC transporter permease n=1 Tax=Ktedonobacter sp. SOSP1-52 TaxID=2778366 RepID=UPI001915AF07|nr:carbohydrate ABC transporter permease [Ktedonobacter sp. SOSP1-52]GHO63840.1 sugar ABC transporter permease [Ktedonobacter sp. SOSP1-52]